MFNNIKQLTKKILTNQSVTDTPTGITSYNTSDDSAESRLQGNAYQNSLYLQKGLSIIKDAISTVEFELYKVTNTKGETENVMIHPVLSLLDNPNPLQTKLEFLRITVVNFKLSGEFFWRIIKNEKQQVIGLVNINPNQITVKLNDNAEIIYTIEGENGKEYTTNDIIHGKDPSPSNPLRGTGVLRTVASRIQTEIASVEYQNGRFLRNDTPDGLLIYKTAALTPDQMGELKKKWFQSFRGVNNKNRTAIIAGDVDYKQLSSQQSNLNFLEVQKQVRDDICMALGIPKSLITTDDVNRANADAGLEQFYRGTLAPLIQIILEAVNQKFIIPYYGEAYFIQTNKLVTEDKTLLLQELKETVNGRNQVITVNEMRQRLGYDPIEGGDELNQAPVNTFNSSQLQNNSYSSRNAKIKSFTGRRNLYTELKAQEEQDTTINKIAVKKVLSSKSFKNTFIKAIEDVRDRGEHIIGKEMDSLFSEQYERAVKRLNAGETTASAIFVKSEEKKVSKQAIMPLYEKISNMAGNVALSPVKTFKKDAKFTMSERLAVKLNKRARLFSDSITDTTYDTIKDIVAENMSSGPNEVANKLKESFANMSATRAYTIARTESCYIASLASEEAYKQSDVVSGKEWLTTGDGAVRDEHVINDGQIVDKDAVFSNGESYPGEQTINCRCALSPVIDIDNLF